jgi:hypothetical protein
MKKVLILELKESNLLGISPLLGGYFMISSTGTYGQPPISEAMLQAPAHVDFMLQLPEL